jgi:hypothetical protein
MQETTVLSYKLKRRPDPAFIVNLVSFWDRTASAKKL